MSEKKGGTVFWAGLVVGVLVGAIAQFASNTPEGKKRVKHILAKGENWLEELEGKGKKFDLTPHFDVDMTDDRAEKMKGFVATTANNLKKRFFKKSGKKLSFFW